MSMIKIKIYKTDSKKSPFKEWLNDLNPTTRALIRTRLKRVELGNFGNCHPIKPGNDICELVIDYGPGYRIYYGKKGFTIIILLIGGEKKTQKRDIIKARQYWQKCEEEEFYE
jgi:putative addiction module killer protein